MRPLGATLSARFPTRFPAWHRSVYEWTRGWVGHRWTGFPCLLLTTTGRRSGERRRTVLTYVELDGDPVVAGSNGGSDRPPAWLLNVEADPRAEVRLGRVKYSTKAERLDPSEHDFTTAWNALNDLRDGRYVGYQSATTRTIPLIRLPRDR